MKAWPFIYLSTYRACFEASSHSIHGKYAGWATIFHKVVGVSCVCGIFTQYFIKILVIVMELILQIL